MPSPHRPPPPLALPRGKRRAGGLGGSLVFHGLLVFVVLFAHERGIALFSADPTAGSTLLPRGGGGGGGGSVVEFVAIQAERPAAPATREVVPPPPPPEVVPEPVPEVVPVPAATSVALTDVPSAAPPSLTPGLGGTGSGGGSGSGTGAGSGSGVGPGSGPGSGGGEGGRARPPEPRQVILPPLDFPKVMRGRTVAVTFWVGADGRVVRVELAPEIPDRGFSRKFEDVMRNYRFRPARSAEGEAIPGTTTVSVTF